jgi:hypothetical protein
MLIKYSLRESISKPKVTYRTRKKELGNDTTPSKSLFLEDVMIMKGTCVFSLKILQVFDCSINVFIAEADYFFLLFGVGA